MKNVRGYVIVVSSGGGDRPERELLLGSRASKHVGETKNSEDLETNGLAPFGSLHDPRVKETYRVLDSRKKRDRMITAIRFARLSLVIAQSSQDIDALIGEDRLVVLRYNKEERIDLIGPERQGKPNLDPLPGALLSDNGYATYYRADEFEDAVRTMEEIERLSRLPTTLAVFSLTILRSPSS